MIYFWNYGLILLLVWLIGRKQPDKVIFYTAFAWKLCTGWALGAIYLRYLGGGDTFAYYESGQLLADQPLRAIWNSETVLSRFAHQPRALFFTKIIATTKALSGGNYWIISAWLSSISFLGFWYFYRQIGQVVPNWKWAVVIGFLFFPSSVFWSAGIMKGTLTNAALVYLSGVMLKIYYAEKPRSYELLFAVLAGIILWFIKYYVLALFLPLALLLLLNQFALRKGINVGIRIGICLFVFGSILFSAPLLNPNLRLSSLPKALSRDQQSFLEITNN